MVTPSNEMQKKIIGLVKEIRIKKRKWESALCKIKRAQEFYAMDHLIKDYECCIQILIAAKKLLG